MIEDQRKALRELYYTTVYEQCFSPCGKYLVAGNNYGDIALFSLASALSVDAADKSKYPCYTFKACQNGEIFSLASTDCFLISAGDGDVKGWRWKDLKSKAAKVAWSFSLPHCGVFPNAEVNSLAVSEDQGQQLLYAGSGDRKIHVWDIETGRYMTALEGHTDYVHKVIMKNGGQECISASEDGSVRLWDARVAGAAVVCIEPYKNDMCARPAMGNWLRCLALDPDEGWLVCGGGPKMSAWHLRTLTPTTVFDTPGVSQNISIFNDEFILSAGSSPCVNHWRLNGELYSSVPCTSSLVFNLSINTAMNASKVLCVCGSSPRIDTCINFGYRAFSFTFGKTSPDSPLIR